MAKEEAGRALLPDWGLRDAEHVYARVNVVAKDSLRLRAGRSASS